LGCGAGSSVNSVDEANDKLIVYTPDTKAAKGFSEGDALSAHLEVLRQLPDDLQALKLKLTVTIGNQSLVLDKEHLTGFNLRFETEPRIDGLRVEEEKVKDMSQSSPNEARRRFVRLLPQVTITRFFDLSQPVRTASQGH